MEPKKNGIDHDYGSMNRGSVLSWKHENNVNSNRKSYHYNLKLGLISNRLMLTIFKHATTINSQFNVFSETCWILVDSVWCMSNSFYDRESLKFIRRHVEFGINRKNDRNWRYLLDFCLEIQVIRWYGCQMFDEVLACLGLTCACFTTQNNRMVLSTIVC